MLEAVNADRTGCFGWAVERYYEGKFGASHGSDYCPERGIVRLVPHTCDHHHANGRNLVGGAAPATTNGSEVNAAAKALPNGAFPGDRSWTWWPSMQELRTHYIHDIGFIACSALTFGATVFWISGFTALPGIYNYLSPQVVLDGVYWVPQVIGGIFFVFSGVLFTIETQKQWWKPAPHVLGWHVGKYRRTYALLLHVICRMPLTLPQDSGIPSVVLGLLYVPSLVSPRAIGVCTRQAAAPSGV